MKLLVWLFAIPWTVACQAPLLMKYSRQENWSGLSFSSPGDFPDPGIHSGQSWPCVSCLAGRFFTIWATREIVKPVLRFVTFLVTAVISSCSNVFINQSVLDYVLVKNIHKLLVICNHKRFFIAHTIGTLSYSGFNVYCPHLSI